MRFVLLGLDPATATTWKQLSILTLGKHSTEPPYSLTQDLKLEAWDQVAAFTCNSFPHIGWSKPPQPRKWKAMIWVPRKVPWKFPSLILKARHETPYLKPRDGVFLCISVCMCEGRGERVVRELLLHTGGIRLLVSLPGRESAYWTCCSAYLSIWWGGGEGLDRDQEVALVAGRHSQTRDGKNKTFVCPKWTLLKSKRAACWLRAG